MVKIYLVGCFISQTLITKRNVVYISSCFCSCSCFSSSFSYLPHPGHFDCAADQRVAAASAETGRRATGVSAVAAAEASVAAAGAFAAA